MTEPSTQPRGEHERRELELLDRARTGDQDAFASLIEPYRRELGAHCYRMLGSLHDAEDALQEAMLRAWRGLARFEGRSSLRAWLYTIATNTCLSAVEKRPKRVLPVAYGPPADPADGPGQPLVESVWIEPYPDEQLAVDDGPAAPDARYERREAVELAFIAALQYLPPNQRAALILREVLGYSAREVASTLETTVASVNSALQRARKTVEERLPERSQQQTARTLGDDGVREVIEAYVDAWDRQDIDGVVAMLTADASFSMPPLGSWYHGPDLPGFFEVGPLSGEWDWRHRLVRANGQPALAFYSYYEPAKAHVPFALNVLSFRGEEISDVTCFVCRSIEATERAAYGRWPDEAPDQRRLEDFFLRFGLPERID